MRTTSCTSTPWPRAGTTSSSRCVIRMPSTPSTRRLVMSSGSSGAHARVRASRFSATACRLRGPARCARAARRNRHAVRQRHRPRATTPRPALPHRQPSSHGHAVKQITDPRVTSSGCCGSARKLPGGDWVISWGANPLITEVTPAGKLVFTLDLRHSCHFAPHPCSQTYSSAAG